MRRLAYLLSGFVIAMILLAGLGVYWLSASAIAQAQRQEAEAVAQGAVLGLATHINLANASLDNIAREPAVLAALLSGNAGLMEMTAQRFMPYLPGLVRLRLLPPDTSKFEAAGDGQLSFADLDMVRRALTAKAPPPAAIQGEHASRYLAIARAVIHDGQTVGVLLASLNHDFTSQVLAGAGGRGNVFLELRQGRATLATAGRLEDGAAADLPKVRVPGTDWQVAYMAKDGRGADFPALGMTFLPALFAGLALLYGYRRFMDMLQQDAQVLLKAAKDLMAGNLKGSYPFQLSPLGAVFSNLLQLKRVLQRGDGQGGLDEISPVNIFVHEDGGIGDGFEISDNDGLDLDTLFENGFPTRKPGR